MNTVVTSREMILAESRKLVMEEGIQAVNMRTVARVCGVAVGSIYNYFPSKADLLSAAVEEVWNDIFHMSEDVFSSQSFSACISWLFESVRKGCMKYPGFFTFHSMSFTVEDKAEGRRMMEDYFGHIIKNLADVIRMDSRVRHDVFDEDFTPEGFSEMIFTQLISMLLKNKEDCRMLLELVERCIY